MKTDQDMDIVNKVTEQASKKKKKMVMTKMSRQLKYKREKSAC